ncbi:MAG: B12-binding domain-containing radical SAM protein [Planctomycetes bacterium]|nr:B12-binding domain-containing radical SAM protein [Planctomycetota bacterium]MCC7171507.1 B12-binding domain-containing radical SAM protein [Planctomycetota bacterium]
MASKKVVLFLPARVDPSIGDLPAADLQPLELLHIASPAEAAGFEVVIIDAMTEPDALDQCVRACDGAVAFASSCILGYQVYDGARVAQAVRTAYPRLPIFWGGWFPSALPELYLNSTFCDAVAHGQGEVTFVELLQACVAEGGVNGDGLQRRLNSIDGLALWRDGKVQYTARRAVKHLNELPEPAWHLIDLNKYYELNARTAKAGNRIRNRLPPPPPFDDGRPFRGVSYFSSFGCPEPCEFCCSPEIAGRRWVALDPDVLVDRLIALHEKWPYDIIRFQDANFGVAEKRTKRFCERLIASKLPVQWNGTIEIKQICQYSEETLDLMKESGFHLAWFGAEAATDATQKLIKKNIKEGLTDQAMKRMHERNIMSGLTYIIGYPGETPESMRATILEAAEMKWKYPTCSSEVFPYRPIPGSGFWEPSVKAGYVGPQTFEDWGRFFDYKFNSWWGQIPPEIQKLWRRYTVLAPWFDGNAGGRGPVSKLLQKAAGWRLKNSKYGAPIEFKAFDMIRRFAGEKAASVL